MRPDRSTIAPRPCGACGLMYKPRTSIRLSRFCSRACHVVGVTTRTERMCRQCGATFLRAPANTGPYCSDPCARLARRISPIVQLETKTTKSETCWEWIGERDRDGYGRIFVAQGRGNSKHRKAHRAAWEIATGQPVPAGMKVLHVCDNPPCWRNDDEGVYVVDGVAHPRRGHLFLGTARINARDAISKGRWPHGDLHSRRTRPETVLRGEQHQNAKLTTADVLEMRRLKDEGASGRSLACRFGVADKTVQGIVKRRAWRHIP